MRIRLLFSLATILTLLAACTQSEADACGKGTEYRDGACHPISGSAGTSSTPSAGGSGEGGQGDSIDPSFGQPCTTSDECSGATNYCTPMSPVDTTYCTVSGCDVDPTICPADWTCFDVSKFVPGEPFICTRPTP